MDIYIHKIHIALLLKTKLRWAVNPPIKRSSSFPRHAALQGRLRSIAAQTRSTVQLPCNVTRKLSLPFLCAAVGLVKKKVIIEKYLRKLCAMFLLL